MAQNGRFGLSVRILAHLALTPDAMTTSASIAEALHTNPVIVRRLFAALGAAGFIVQRKGPQGGAKLMIAPKAIGLGDVYAAISGDWLTTKEKGMDALLKRVRQDAVAAMNETSIATLTKRLKKQQAHLAASWDPPGRKLSANSLPKTRVKPQNTLSR